MTKHFHEFPNSTSIRSCEYNEATKDMHITFCSGGKHCYKNVEPEDFHDFKTTDSVGKHFHSRIRNKYESEKVD